MAAAAAMCCSDQVHPSTGLREQHQQQQQQQHQTRGPQGRPSSRCVLPRLLILCLLLLQLYCGEAAASVRPQPFQYHEASLGPTAATPCSRHTSSTSSGRGSSSRPRGMYSRASSSCAFLSQPDASVLSSQTAVENTSNTKCTRCSCSSTSRLSADKSSTSNSRKRMSSSNSRSSSSSHAFTSTVLLPRSSMRLRGGVSRTELAIQRIWRTNETYQQLLLQIWCMNMCAEQLKSSRNSSIRNNEATDVSGEWLNILNFAVTAPNDNISKTTRNSNSKNSCTSGINNSGNCVLLLDGPPYANGEPHLGHAVNKCLKDFFVRSALLQRRCCHMLPGWDCHGLPIELRAAAAATAEREAAAAAEHQAEVAAPVKGSEGVGTSTVRVSARGSDYSTTRSSSNDRGSAVLEDEGEELRRRARAVALHFASRQQTAFERFGVWGHWKDAYKTLDSEYKADEARLFALLWTEGIITPAQSPVYWSSASLSAVAESEVTLKPTPRICMHFKLQLQQRPPVALSSPARCYNSKQAPAWFLVAWTTTPFTVPANRALAVCPDARYAILKVSRKSPVGAPPPPSGEPLAVEHQGQEEIWIVGEKCVSSLTESLHTAGLPWSVEHLDTISGHLLGGLRYFHPLASDVTCPILTDTSVAEDKGTGVLHVAPGHSLEDFRLCERAGSKAFLVIGADEAALHVPLLGALGEEVAAAAKGAPRLCPVCPDGRYLGGNGTEGLKGLRALGEGEQQILASLRRKGSLVLAEEAVLPFPHDERRGDPLIFRATPQLHFNLQALLPGALKDLQRVCWLPSHRRQKQQQQNGRLSNPDPGESHTGTQLKPAQDPERDVAGSDAERLAAPGYERMVAALLTRPSTWCLSRQRQWGLPIPLVTKSDKSSEVSEAKAEEHEDVEAQSWRHLMLDKGFDVYAEASPGEAHQAEGFVSSAIASAPTALSAVLVLLVSGRSGHTRHLLRGWCGATFDVWFDSGTAWLRGHKFIRQWTANARRLLAKHLPQQSQQQLHQDQQPQPYTSVIIEGSDQSRGWFQSLLLSHAGVREALRRQRGRGLLSKASELTGTRASQPSAAAEAMHAIHAAAEATAERQQLADDGTLLEERDVPALPFGVVGNKLSKSKGNALSPSIFFDAESEGALAPAEATAAKAAAGASRSTPAGEKQQQQQQQRDQGKSRGEGLLKGADVLRLFVASLDFGGDMACPSAALQQQEQQQQKHKETKDTAVHAASNNYVKLRNTFRYILGNLYDFDFKAHAISLENLPLLDLALLLRLKDLVDETERAYEAFQPNKVLRSVLRFVSEDLSSFYLEIAKDRLYLDHMRGYRRRSCQTVLLILLLTLLPMVAPLTPHLAEEVFLRLPKRLRMELSVHRNRRMGWPRMQLPVNPQEAVEAQRMWDLVVLLRQDLHSLMTKANAGGARLTGSSPIRSFNEAKLHIAAPTEESYHQLRLMLPEAKLLRPAPLADPLQRQPPQHQQGGRDAAPPTPAAAAKAGAAATAARRSFVDDLRWLLQCSEVVLEPPFASAEGTHFTQQTVKGTAKAECELLAHLQSKDSKSGLNLFLYRATGPRCQRCWMRDEAPSLEGPKQGERAAAAAAATVETERRSQQQPFACLRCQDVIGRRAERSLGDEGTDIEVPPHNK
ncbi:hypothetical protein Emed_001899 [Eimeria media]